MIDVSEYQGKVNWSRVHKAGVRRAFVKLGQSYTHGGYGLDPQARLNAKAARAAGVKLGFYWYGTPSNAPHREAAAFLSLYEPLSTQVDIVPALDLEETRGHSWEFLNDWKAQWFARVDHELRCRSFFYSYFYFWRQMRLYEDRPVWGAAFGGGFVPPASWTLWQHGTGAIPGIRGLVDVDRPLRPVPTLAGSL